MPFHRRSAPPQRRRNDTDDDLLRLGGLWDSKSGKAITGSVNVIEPQDEGEPPFGEVLIQWIEQAMSEERPLRFLVFEVNSQSPRGPSYSLNMALGDQRPADRESRPPLRRSSAPPPRSRPQMVEDAVDKTDRDGIRETDAAISDVDNQEPIREPEPEPTPRPVRRPAPRR